MKGPEVVKGPEVKICGLTRVEDARVAAGAGADYLGAILSPGFSRSVPAERAATFVVPGGPPLVAVLVDGGLEEAVGSARTAGAGVLQLHGEEPPERLRDLRDRGDWRIWKALRVRSPDDVARALERYADVADGLLLEGWHEGRGGGVGVSFPWEAVVRLRESFPPGLSLIAAGGLGPDNVGEAVRRLAPDVVDVSSGVEARTGVKDPERVQAFLRNARAAGGVLKSRDTPGRDGP